jgi:hypothetical protein
MCGTVAWLEEKSKGDDEQFDLAAWFLLFHIILTHATPLKPRIPRWRITEVIDIMPYLPQLSDNLWIELIAPTACYIYLAFHIECKDIQIIMKNKRNSKSFAIEIVSYRQSEK